MSGERHRVHRTRRRALGVMTALALSVPTLAGCSDDKATGQEPRTASTATAAPIGPLDAYQREVYSILGPSGKAWNKQQEVIARCMADQGFEYQPVPPPQVTTVDDLEAQKAAQSRPEFYEKYGYGILTQPPTAEQPAPDQAENPEQAADPNQARLEKMSGPELAAYNAALHGKGSPPDAKPREKGDTDTKWKYEGCTGKAEHEVVGGPGSDQDPTFESLRKAIVKVGDELWDSPEMDQIYADWSGCMADAGYSGLKTPQDAQMYVSDNAAKGGRSEQQRKQFEIDVATADFGCQDKVSLHKRITTWQHDKQAEFVSQHKNELDAWVQAARSSVGDTGP